MLSYIKDRNKLFFKELLNSKLFIVTICAYVILKIVSNITYGASYFTAIRSGIIGTLMYILGYYIINLFSVNNQKVEKKFKIENKVARSGIIAAILYFAFLFLKIVDGIQREEIIVGKPILSYVPGYDWMIATINDVSQSIATIADFINPHHISNIISGVIFYVAIPIVIFKLLGYSFKGLFSFKNTRASWPFLGLYTITFIVSGLSIAKIWGLIYSILYPGLCEEFFHRGIIARTTFSIFKKVGIGLIVGTLLFSLIHFPDTYYRMYDRNLLMTLSRMGSVLMYGLLLAYGFRKTGTLLPWILIHALEDTFYL